MWMTEHLANIELGRTFGKVFADIPLKDSAHIVHGDALAIAWDDVLPREECFAVMGNPPFAGAKFQSAEQRQDRKSVVEGKRRSVRVDLGGRRIINKKSTHNNSVAQLSTKK